MEAKDKNKARILIWGVALSALFLAGAFFALPKDAKGIETIQDAHDSRIEHIGAFKTNSTHVNDLWNFVHFGGSAAIYTTTFYTFGERKYLKSYLIAAGLAIGWEILDGFKPLYYVEDDRWGGVPYADHIMKADGFSFSDVIIDLGGIHLAWLMSLRHAEQSHTHQEWEIFKAKSGFGVTYKYYLP